MGFTVGLLENRGTITHSHIILGLICLPLFRQNIAQRGIQAQGEPLDHAVYFPDGAELLLGVDSRIDVLRRQPLGELADICHVVILLNVLPGAGNSYGVQKLEVVHIHHLNKGVCGSLLVRQLRPLVEDALCLLQEDFQIGDAHFRKGVIAPLGDEVDLVLDVVHAVVHRNFCLNAGLDHILHQPLIPSDLVLGGVIIAEVMTLVNHNQIVIAPVYRGQIDISGFAAVSA